MDDDDDDDDDNDDYMMVMVMVIFVVMMVMIPMLMIMKRPCRLSVFPQYEYLSRCDFSHPDPRDCIDCC